VALLVAGPSFINAAGTHSISVVFSSVRVNFRVRVRGIIGADNKKLMFGLCGCETKCFAVGWSGLRMRQEKIVRPRIRRNKKQLPYLPYLKPKLR
jgi:hypothetical protein